MPLLFGPVAVLDNMLVDNLGLVDALAKPENCRIMRLYASNGLLQLWPRESYCFEGQKHSVSTLDDLLMIWLSRTDSEAVSTVGFASLSDAINQELRDLISSFGERHNRTARIKAFYEFMDTHIYGYSRAIQNLRPIFFEDNRTRSPWSAYPSTLQVRVLSALGVSAAKAAIGEAVDDDKSLEDVLLRRQGELVESTYSPYIDFFHFVMAAKKEDGPHRDFLRRMTTVKDAEYFNLYRAAQDVAELDPIVGDVLRKVIVAAYAGGIPEANGRQVLWPYSVEDFGQTSAAAEFDDDERNDVRQAILEAPASVLENARKIGQLLQHADDDTARCLLRCHLDRLQDGIFHSQKEKPPDRLMAWVENVSGYSGAAITALGASYIPEIGSLVAGAHELVALFGIAGVSGFKLFKAAARPALCLVYPWTLGRNGMYGRAGGSFYMHGWKLIWLDERKHGDAWRH